MCPRRVSCAIGLTSEDSPPCDRIPPGRYHMALLLSEADVKSILTMPLAIEAVDASFRRLADGSALLHSRQRLHLPERSYLHYMAAGDLESGYMGLKIYSSS